MKTVIVLLCILVSTSTLPAKIDLITSFSLENRIAGGHEAAEGQFPFQVGLRTRYITKDNQQYNAWCGGSLISDQVVLTAAHCVIDGIFTEVYMGVSDLRKNPLIIKVSKEGMISHEGYSQQSSENDIGLIILPDKIKFTDKIQPVNLPRKSQRGTPFEKTIGWISGWGNLGDGKDSPEILQYTRRWILRDNYCEYFHPAFYKKETQICVDGSHGISACQGDSGGPLTIVEDDGSRILLGATSYGRFQCEKGYPVVYTRITAYLDWIAEKGGITLRD